MSKDEQRRQAKEQKKLQLNILLVNKFRNKFGVNSVNEPEIDNIIKQEVQELLTDSNMYESKLNQIDRKLESCIQ